MKGNEDAREEKILINKKEKTIGMETREEKKERIKVQTKENIPKCKLHDGGALRGGIK